MHPLLLPGTHVLRRPDGVFQLGLAPTEAVRLEHEDAGGRLAPVDGSPGLAESPALTARLVAQHAAAADDAHLRRALAPDRPENRWQRHTMASLFRDAPALMAARVDERGTKRIRVRGFGHPLDETLRTDLLDLLRRASLTPHGPRPSGPPARHALPTEPVHVLLGVGEPSRSLVDPLLREAVPHLVVRLSEGAALVGPFVLPGLSPCLRCLDAHVSEDDPAWTLLVEQYSRAARRGDRADGVPEPVDAVLAALAVAWAAREVATYAEGGTPETLGATVRLSPRTGATTTRRWEAHPHCGCAWRTQASDVPAPPRGDDARPAR
ncbi:TOMM precursor leader peptide-binding protein [Nocardioides sp. HDW12B]|uniref:TOMM precursor leader peptide-binding protein n=1 Tax=Nocardioides sp. HDW12B TaxID=2714939 RepID=UPI00140DF3C1|nr:TOMM precursor leader peptide-binding protein [Nocardioides sp. HDW12B]QIK67397.1 TOMM precursor leader peptide-binding protein [Nocardioides sp. HDW12B]